MFDSNSPRPIRHDDRLTSLLWTSAVGTYLLLAIGGVTTLLDGGAACSSWPTCRPQALGELSDPAVAVAVGHRIAALGVGLLLAVILVLAWRRQSDRVTASIALATLLYPLQIGVGALTATRESAVLSDVHLVLGITIFGLTLLALLWHLERTDANAPAAVDSADDSTGRGPPSPPVNEATEAEPPDRTDTAGRRFGVRDRAFAYLSLTKPRLMWLLCLVAVATMALAAGPALTVRTTVVTVAGGMLAIGASGTFNNVLERDVDRQMDRTADRPLVQRRIPVRRAVAFGLLLAVASVGLFGFFVNVLAALLAALAILFYSVLYTIVLKPHTRQNIVLGGAVGAFPALIGWAAVEDEIGIPALVLGAVIFLWTPAHFYNLALAYRDDYEKAGFPMLPVECGAAKTRRHVLLYLGATLIGSVVLGVTTRLDWLYALTIALVGGVFLWTVLRLFREQTERAAFRCFHASNAYLGCVMLAILVDTLLV